MQVKDESLQKWNPSIAVDRVYDIDGIQWNGGLSLLLRPDDIDHEKRSDDPLTVCWDSVVCYQVTQESFRPDCWISNPEEAWTFFVSSSSGYLASARKNNPVLPEKLFHFAIIGTNTIVDVIAEKYPEIVIGEPAYEKTQAGLKLMSELAKGERSGAEKGWMDIADVEKELGISQ